MRLFFGTLIGYYVKIIFSSNRNYEGIEGIVIDETRNMLVIKDDNNRISRVLKKGSIFKVSLGNTEYTFEGDDLIGDIVKRVIRI